MFTGLVKTVGTVQQIRRTSSGAQLVVDAGPMTSALALGDSVSVSGVCLTVTEIDGVTAAFDAVEETMRLTTLGKLASGHKVNLEPALRAGEAIGGHFVSGHVDGAAEVSHITPVGEGAEIVFRAEAAVLADVVKKGSIAVDGISLTVAEIGDDTFRIAVIPHTLRETTLSQLRPGSKVNVETDMLVKAVRRVLTGAAPRNGRLTEDFLRQHGFA